MCRNEGGIFLLCVKSRPGKALEMHVINLLDCELKPENFGPKYLGATRELGNEWGSKLLGFHVEVLDPKMFSCPYHWHEKEEELAVVLEGQAILRVGNQFRKVQKGDLLFFPPGTATAHHLYNHTDQPFKFLAMSSKVITDEKCHYPDSNKVMDRLSRTITQNGQPVPYFKDEQDPSQYWPAEALQGKVPVREK
jgi:uncharacterized cupin superfamily protein